MENTRLSFLFYQYVNNTCSASERQELLRLLADAKHEVQVKMLMAELWNDVSAGQMSLDQSDRIFRNIVIKNNRNITPWLKLAAVFTVVAIFVTWMLTSAPLKVLPQDPLATTVANTNPDFIVLPDGSTVILNAGSTLHFPESFNENVREVFLEGEGFFDIRHDPSREFVVHTGTLKTTVLGTAFNIRAYPDQKDIIITVKRGKVKVGDDEQVYGIINPNQQITFDRHHKYVEQKPADSNKVTAWMEKDIVFDDITMVAAVTQLEKRFDVTIEIANAAIRDCKFTATFMKGEDLDQILRVLCEFNHATLLENSANGFVIDGGGC